MFDCEVNTIVAFPGMLRIFMMHRDSIIARNDASHSESWVPSE